MIICTKALDAELMQIGLLVTRETSFGPDLTGPQVKDISS